MSKFSEYFSEVQCFTGGYHAISGDYSKEEAARLFSEYMDQEIETDDVGSERVRFGFAPENVEDLGGELCWYTGAGNGKGTKAVWVIN